MAVAASFPLCCAFSSPCLGEGNGDWVFGVRSLLAPVTAPLRPHPTAGTGHGLDAGSCVSHAQILALHLHSCHCVPTMLRWHSLHGCSAVASWAQAVLRATPAALLSGCVLGDSGITAAGQEAISILTVPPALGGSGMADLAPALAVARDTAGRPG